MLAPCFTRFLPVLVPLLSSAPMVRAAYNTTIRTSTLAPTFSGFHVPLPSPPSIIPFVVPNGFNSSSNGRLTGTWSGGGDAPPVRPSQRPHIFEDGSVLVSTVSTRLAGFDVGPFGGRTFQVALRYLRPGWDPSDGLNHYSLDLGFSLHLAIRGESETSACDPDDDGRNLDLDPHAVTTMNPIAIRNLYLGITDVLTDQDLELHRAHRATHRAQIHHRKDQAKLKRLAEERFAHHVKAGMRYFRSKQRNEKNALVVYVLPLRLRSSALNATQLSVSKSPQDSEPSDVACVDRNASSHCFYATACGSYLQSIWNSLVSPIFIGLLVYLASVLAARASGLSLDALVSAWPIALHRYVSINAQREITSDDRDFLNDPEPLQRDNVTQTEASTTTWRMVNVLQTVILDPLMLAHAYNPKVASTLCHDAPTMSNPPVPATSPESDECPVDIPVDIIRENDDTFVAAKVAGQVEVGDVPVIDQEISVDRPVDLIRDGKEIPDAQLSVGRKVQSHAGFENVEELFDSNRGGVQNDSAETLETEAAVEAEQSPAERHERLRTRARKGSKIFSRWPKLVADRDRVIAERPWRGQTSAAQVRYNKWVDEAANINGRVISINAEIDVLKQRGRPHPEPLVPIPMQSQPLPNPLRSPCPTSSRTLANSVHGPPNAKRQNRQSGRSL